MRRVGLRQALPCLVALLAPAGVGSAHQAAESSGVIVEELARGFAGEGAGLKPGDLLLSWRQPKTEEAGEIGSPFDFSDLVIEQSPRGDVELVGRRGAERLAVTLEPREWRVKVRPVLAEECQGWYLAGKAQIDSKKLEAGVALWRKAVEAAKERGDEAAAAWLLLGIGDILTNAQRWGEAQAAYGEALDEAARLRRPLVEALVLEARGVALQKQNDLERAGEAHRAALEIREQIAPRSLRVAGSLQHLTKLEQGARRGDKAAELARRVLEIRQALAPASLVLADAQNDLGIAAWDAGDLEAAERRFREALAIKETLAPGTLAEARILNNLGVLAWARGDLAGAAQILERSLLAEEKDPTAGPEDAADTLNNLGLVALDRGDLAGAETRFRNALRVYQGLPERALDVAMAWHNLGNVASGRGDLDGAEGAYRRSAAIKERLAPASMDLSLSLGDLAGVLISQGRLQEAEELARRSLALREKIAPTGWEYGGGLGNLADVLEAQGDLDGAEEALKRAVEIEERLAPGGYRLAEHLRALGEVAERRGDFDAAEAYYRRGLAIRERLTPGTSHEAEILHSLGSVARTSGRTAQAAELFERALQALEAHRGRIGTSEEARSSFSAKYARFYRDAIEVLMALGRSAEAFHVLERSRARALLAMLAERDLLFATEVPPDLERERRSVDADYDRTQSALAALHPTKDAGEGDTLRGRLREIRARQDDVASRIRAASPHLAALQYPKPLDLEGVRQSLDPGTLLLAYSVGKEKTDLFAVEPQASSPAGPGLSALTLPAGDAGLREKIEAFRKALKDGAVGTGRPGGAEELRRVSRELYDLLLRPAEPLIESSERILISLDGPLHILPFAALAPGERQRAKGLRYLVEWKPLHTIVSATTYAEVRRSRRAERSEQRLVAFGDPKYPALSKNRAEALSDATLRSLVDRGLGFGALPSTRDEVQGIARLDRRRSLSYLGEQATEERAKSVGKDARFIHFACHGILDQRFPLDSALALTIPEHPGEGQDNGLLQAWEILERMRIDADLVTLSACETGLGREMGGEGLVGLTRAFQFAGARSVLASLWSVSDRSTTELMKAFYGYLKAGKPKDEALRAAQIDLIRGRIRVTASSRRRAIGGLSVPGGVSDTSHPFHWAAFQLIGDWK